MFSRCCNHINSSSNDGIVQNDVYVEEIHALALHVTERQQDRGGGTSVL